VPKWFLTSKYSTSRHFQNIRHNTAQIQHCPISTTFHMWVDYDVPKWATFEIEQCWIFAVLWWPFWKWRLVEIFQSRESIQDVEIGQCWICAWPFWKAFVDRKFRMATIAGQNFNTWTYYGKVNK
jgi:hypothetical protein